VTSVEIVSPEAPADNWAGSPLRVCLLDVIALGPDGDEHAPIPSPPNTTNKVHARLNTFVMFHL
jgi:hypothetical protein